MKSLLLLTLMLVPAVAFAGGGDYKIKKHPVKVEKIAGSEFSTVILTEKAAIRTGIETDQLREDTVTRTWLVGGLVLSSATPASTTIVAQFGGIRADTIAESERQDGVGSAKTIAGLDGSALVRVPVSPSELHQVAADKPARILPLTRGVKKTWLTAKPSDKMPIDADQPLVNLHYTVAGTDHNLVPGQRVSVELARVGADKPQKIVPYSSVLYGVHGETWVYTNPKPLVYVRHPIRVNFVEGDIAVLTDGPSVGTTVVSVGAIELFGAETGIGK
jgi:hypothetical protein